MQRCPAQRAIAHPQAQSMPLVQQAHHLGTEHACLQPLVFFLKDRIVPVPHSTYKAVKVDMATFAAQVADGGFSCALEPSQSSSPTVRASNERASPYGWPPAFLSWTMNHVYKSATTALKPPMYSSARRASHLSSCRQPRGVQIRASTRRTRPQWSRRTTRATSGRVATMTLCWRGVRGGRAFTPPTAPHGAPGAGGARQHRSARRTEVKT